MSTKKNVFIREKDLELYHHGVPGMKWGVRRAVRKSYRALEKRNKLHDKYNSLVDKTDYYKSKGNPKKAGNTESKAWKTLAKYYKADEKSTKEANRAMDWAKKQKNVELGNKYIADYFSKISKNKYAKN